MKNLILYTLGSIAIVIASAAITFFTLNALSPKEEKADSSATTIQTPEASNPTETEVKPAMPIEEQDKMVERTLASLERSVQMYWANNHGNLPSTQALFEEYKVEALKDVDLTKPLTNTTYEYLLNSSASSSVITLQIGYVCSDTDMTVVPQTDGTSTKFALSVILPSGALFCTSSKSF